MRSAREPNERREAARGLAIVGAMRKKAIGLALGADTSDLDVFLGHASFHERQPVALPQVETALCEELRPVGECPVHVLAHLVASRPDGWANAGHDVLGATAEPLDHRSTAAAAARTALPRQPAWTAA